jgi:hypothetical protein
MGENMKTKYQYIKFIPGSFPRSWEISTVHRTKDYLGEVRYNEARKEYELLPDNYTAWSKQSLKDVVDFMKQLEEADNGKQT